MPASGRDRCPAAGPERFGRRRLPGCRGAGVPGGIGLCSGGELVRTDPARV